MKWLWVNKTQIAFGQQCVKEHLKTFVKPKSKVICTFGGGSINNNGCRKDVQDALDALKCTVRWEGGILANPEFDRCVEIANIVKQEKPDLILAVGGGSVLDGTKYISLAAKLDDGLDPWTIITEQKYPAENYNVGCVLTIPATGSEWNSNFVISRRSINAKLPGGNNQTFPVFSLIDPRYMMTLPPRQLRNGVYDAITHVIDQFLTPEESPMFDNFWLSVIKELVDIGPDVVQEGSSIELHERLIVAASFALNFIFTLAKDQCWGIHMIGHQLTAKYDIDHAASLAIVGPFLLENQFERRIPLLAKSAEFAFGVKEGTQEEKARAFISELRKFIIKIGQPTKVSEWEGAKIGENDVEVVTKMVMGSVGGQPFGFHGQITEDVVRDVLKHVIV
ncbi:alcohol dehydrogenase, iron-containing family protein [Tritrichomonas foetus]|uniref:Alcohol dehydrogenase, iron-containing family protein n=1 Tax=Tritrichomonas foetus TaxID=1144522 RepID=A0A1J4KJ83_9EUKA|nr:alcohol dehydrogenase, iron-containing family protein [Tritrichomonas foetus]|eukprot:OHT09397.1 alcohol dehydrogenase, iron-containing family protein [Tritrichomonas foetus]